MNDVDGGLFKPFERIRRGKPSTTSTVTFGSLPYRDLAPAQLDLPCAACQFPLPFALLLRNPSVFRVRLFRHAALILVREEKQEAFDKRKPIAKLEGTDLLRDRAGIVKYSEVEVQLPSDLIQDQSVATQLGYDVPDVASALKTQSATGLNPTVKKLAVFLTNRLLRTYRFLSGQHHIRPIVEGDIFYMQTGWHVVPGGGGLVEMAVGAPGEAITLEAEPFSDMFHFELANWLVAERDVPLWIELLQDAREHLDVGRFRHVVIDSRTALELYVDQTLLAEFEARSAAPEIVADTLRLSADAAHGSASIEEVLGRARVNDKLKFGIKEVLGIRLAQRRVWESWIAAKKLREGSVHYGRDISEEEARLALRATEELIRAIHEAGSPVSAPYLK